MENHKVKGKKAFSISVTWGTDNLNNIPRNERECKRFENEYHFILECPFNNDCKKQYLKQYYYKYPATFKLVQPLSTENITERCKLGKYLHKCSSIRSQLLL
jgi:hypothetical protein